MFDITKRLREIRFILGKTQREMASALGMPTRSWQNYEYGSAGQFSAADLYKLCEAFHLSADFFFGRTRPRHTQVPCGKPSQGIGHRLIEPVINRNMEHKTQELCRTVVVSGSF